MGELAPAGSAKAYGRPWELMSRRGNSFVKDEVPNPSANRFVRVNCVQLRGS